MSLTLSQVLSVATIAQWEAQLLSYELTRAGLSQLLEGALGMTLGTLQSFDMPRPRTHQTRFGGVVAHAGFQVLAQRGQPLARAGRHRDHMISAGDRRRRRIQIDFVDE